MLLIALSLLVAYTSWSIIHAFIQANEVATEQNKNRARLLINQAHDATLLLEDGRLVELESRLRDAVEYGELNSFRILKGDERVAQVDKDKLIDQLQVPEKNQLYTVNNVRYIEFDVGDYTVLIANLDIDERVFVSFMKANATLFVRDIAIVFLMAAVILAFFLKDILKIISVIREGRSLKTLQTNQAQSSEGAVLLQSLSTMNMSIADLEAQNRQLRNQVLPALNSELMSGRKPPYEFFCTLVRVDVNNFSHLFATQPTETFMKTINQFFEQVTEIVSRYKGYVYEFVGDEVIFYFKDEEHENSAMMAMAAVRDILHYADFYNDWVYEYQGYNFRIKASMGHGRLRFGQQVTNYTLAGGVLIETVRILGQIHERSANLVYYDKTIAGKIQDLFHSQPEGKVLLKGFSEKHHLFSFAGGPEIEEILSQISVDSTHRLDFYRSDRDLISILTYLRNGARVLDLRLFLNIARRLRNTKVPIASAQVQQAYHDLLETLHQHTESASTSEDDLFRLSAGLTIAMHLLDEESFRSRFQVFFKSCLNFSDRRVVANSVDVLAHFVALDEDRVYHQLMQDKDNRVAANALVKEGYKGLTKPLVKQTQKLLASSDPNYVASGLYVIGELAKYHRQYNRVHYDTAHPFLSLVQRISTYLNDDHQAIRRQALIAARKSADEGLRAHIEDLYLSSESKERKSEIEKFFLQSSFSRPNSGHGSAA